MATLIDALGNRYDPVAPGSAVGIDANGVLYSLAAPAGTGIDKAGNRYSLAAPGTARAQDADGTEYAIATPTGRSFIDADGARYTG